jgi:hypothetical protein
VDRETPGHTNRGIKTMQFAPPPHIPAHTRQRAPLPSFPARRFTLYLVVAAALMYFMISPGMA